jgi:hypothetical protein
MGMILTVLASPRPSILPLHFPLHFAESDYCTAEREENAQNGCPALAEICSTLFLIGKTVTPVPL